MKTSLRIAVGALLGAVLGLVFPYGIALLNALPFLKAETPYETVMSYMFFSAIFGAVIGGVWVYRKALKNTALR